MLVVAAWACSTSTASHIAPASGVLPPPTVNSWSPLTVVIAVLGSTNPPAIWVVCSVLVVSLNV
jgi:hypothetical protein